MSLHIGTKNIVDIRKGTKKIARVYKGDKLVWGYFPNEVLFESSTPGTHTLYVKCRCKLHIDVVGAGGGAASWGGYYSNGVTINSSGGGGSGGYISGNIEIQPGTYTVIVGAGGSGDRSSGIAVRQAEASNGGESSVFGQIAYGGIGGYTSNDGYGGAGGTCDTVLTGVEGNSGGSMKSVARYDYQIQNISGGASKYGGYGAGGYIENNSLDNYNGLSGYVKITAI